MKDNTKKIDIISFGFEDAFNPKPITELEKHNLIKFLQYLKEEPNLSNKIFAIRTSHVKFYN